MVEDLLPEPHNSKLLTLLYRLAEWHALAKLRMHTEVTLGHLENATVTIGKELRSFRDTIAAAYTCKELPGETSRRARRLKKKKDKSRETSVIEPSQASESSTVPPTPIPNPIQPPDHQASLQALEDTQVPAPPLPKLVPKIKILSLCTYKLHALGDYVRTIRLFGTTDSYSTQIVSVFY